MVVSFDSVKPTNPEPGVTRRVIAHGDDIMAVHVTFQKGAVGSVHTHPHRQVTYVAAGSFEYYEGGEKRLLKAGDSYFVPAGVEHGVTALEDSVLIDVFTPQRDDFLSCS